MTAERLLCNISADTSLKLSINIELMNHSASSFAHVVMSRATSNFDSHLAKVHLIWQGGMKILKLEAWNFSSPLASGSIF